MACELQPSKGIIEKKKRRALRSIEVRGRSEVRNTFSAPRHQHMAGGGLVPGGSEKGKLRGLNRESEVSTDEAPLVTEMCPLRVHT